MVRPIPRPPVRSLLQNVFLGILLVIMTLSALCGIAAAVWTAVGSGSGTAAAGTTVAVTLTPGTPSTPLYPGGQGNVVLTVSSTNTAPVRIGSFSRDASRGVNGFGVDAAHSNCLLTALTFTTQTNGTTGWTVPAKVGSVDATLPITLTNALAMSTAATNACQGAAFTVYLLGQP